MPHDHPLKRVERELKVPPQRRLDLIEEVDADVRALQVELERRGKTPSQARRAALRQAVPDDQALADLEARHAPRLGRWAGAAGWVDRAVVLGVALAATSAGFIAVIAMYGSGVPDVPAFVIWPLTVVIAALAANLSRAVIQLLLHGDLRPRQRRLLWARQAGLVVAAVTLGALGAAWVGRVTFAPLEPPMIAAPESTVGEPPVRESPMVEPPRQGSPFEQPPVWEPPVWEAVGRMATVAGTGLAAAVFGLFGWLALTPRLLTDEEAEHRIARFFAQARPHLALASETSPDHQRKGEP
ncbi:MAG: hypothetical protein F4123_02245 [Gemmatimonadetes bacterium]|nr:hypothetical protein [Gemmatimonadota bacterium]MYB98654.1 hypothetical protein [Gemmatimonadota bacterium]MYI45211.1 hypothetical protein [Gemmatimonadota bacterium]